MATYLEATVEKTFVISEDYYANPAFIGNVAESTIYTCPSYKRARVIIDILGAGGMLGGNFHRFVFRHYKNLVNSTKIKEFNLRVAGSANTAGVKFNGISNANPLGEWINMDGYTDDLAFDLSPGDTISRQGIFDGGDLNTGERVYFRLRVEETGPA